ncbi:ArsR family transcriptional regulator [Phycicoccus sp. CSK15P-2]|uniref:helix-turn-helix transcriptional regulator n=1 Tax=Phycicoccus sp. CSK15P-2 TaxID=2807627 RepID=UPI0019510294|nr:helix-turn-helix domain-containing protein [Phycicoccus sp. CSK15P-2]MBM6403848.1 ArsR family transcriptional regulator [Phycicoccus sp. CSK15P-2]
MVNADAHLESRTRDRVLRVVSQAGPVSIAGLVDQLGLTETAVRRHVSTLHADGLVEPREGTAPRRRGRPAKVWVLSEAGHRALASDYDHLAGDALRFLRRTGGESAVQAFAEERVAGLEARIAGRLVSAGDDPRARADALVDALNTEGYSASTRPVGTPDAPPALTGVQLCQGHCPIQHVASEFPELCEAETEAFSRLLGVHVQRLATLAHGDHVCTTFVPTPTTERPSR